MTHLGPVEGIDLYASDLVVRRRGYPTTPTPAIRGNIREFSTASRKRLAFVASNTSVVFTTMYTLTYPSEYPSNGRKVARHRKVFLDWLRRETGHAEYLWFLEFQKRGAPHIHILTDQLWPRARREVTELRLRVAATWYRIVASRDEKHLAAGTRTEKLRSPRGGAHYAVKYSMKMRQKLVPEGYENVGRFWGHSRKVKPESQGFVRCTEHDVRGLLEGSTYAPDDSRFLWKVLYNARDIYDAFVDMRDSLDK